MVCIKQVPARDSVLKLNSSASWIEGSDLSYEINEPDAYALEEALQLKEKQGGEVVVLCAGPARAGQTIREALAKGADRAMHIEEEDLGRFDPLSLARLLAAARKRGLPALDGLSMLVYQGVIGFRFWTGCEAPEAVMKTALRSALGIAAA